MIWAIPPEPAVPVEFKDYYDVLGVARDASDEEINEADQGLSDPDNRRKYNELGANWNHPERRPTQPQGGFGGGPEEGSEFHFDGTGLSVFSERFFGNRGHPYRGFGRRGGDGTAGAPFGQRGQDTEGDILVTPARLAVSSHHAAGLLDTGTGGEDLVYSQVWRMMAVARRTHSLAMKPNTAFQKGRH